MPDLVENDGLHNGFKSGQHHSKLTRLTARVHKLHPAGTVQHPVRMQQSRRNAVLQVEDTCSERGEDGGLAAERRAAPRELTGWRQAELVREMAPLVTLVRVLVFV